MRYQRGLAGLQKYLALATAVLTELGHEKKKQ